MTLKSLFGCISISTMLLAAPSLADNPTNAVGTRAAGNLPEQILASYDWIQTLSCEVQKDVSVPTGQSRKLSRFYYEAPNRLHVENVNTPQRTVIADGAYFYSYSSDDERGYSCRMDELPPELATTIRRIPGTAVAELAPLIGASETDLTPNRDYPIRKGYSLGQGFVVVSLNEKGQLARIEQFRDPAMKQLVSTTAYGAYRHVGPEIWLPCWQQTTRYQGRVRTEETIRLTNLYVNKPIASQMFTAGLYFPGVEFGK